MTTSRSCSAGRATATIHAHRRDGSPYPEEECPLLRPRETGEAVQVDDDWFIRRDGSMVPVAYSSAPFRHADGRAAVVVFRDMTTRLRGRAAAAAGGGRARPRAGARRRRAGGSSRRPTPSAGGSGATCTTARSSASSTSSSTCRWRSPRPAPADDGRRSSSPARSTRRARRSRTCASSRPACTRRSSSTAGCARAIVALTARAPLPVTFDVPDVRLPPVGRGRLLLRHGRGADERRQARGRRPRRTSTCTVDDGQVVV